MREMELGKAFTLLEPGPVVLVTTHDGKKHNIMTISWTMVLDFTPAFGICTGAWNYSFAALRKHRECVIAIPTVDLLDEVVGIGTCSGADTDKFDKFGLTPEPGKHVKAPLIKECLANIECRVVDMVRKHNLIVLEGVAAYKNTARKEKRTLHAVGDGTFIVDGDKLDRRKMMANKIPAGV
ncbi:flavin reductase (DIM6/NTAB) family NADH-FMN oxidoreductase RutF [Sulfuritortus calidifontis]|uniref:Flavin reductase (DIM6/NTAB) family NADH-FMN oxidoreductase RutF n=1 Tax=Sulfuritortus calidifontis TaxID=1914471 RepID=A0A4R3JQI1_9PROT|nr:flavin reductase family protein [Sulfuritortus calidifontis]TCS69007.1 flavin reductase (DIM6/NTAB) family NADH-FMN oxidoreductase RutF [Sulfuritortus calidifontis]